MKNHTYNTIPAFHFSSFIKNRHTKKRLLGIIFGNFGAYNVGDEAILAGQLDELKKIDSLSVTVIARYPEKIKQIHKASSISLFALKNVFQKVIASDFIIVGGGGLICKNTNGIRGIAFQLYYLWVFCIFPLILRKDVYVLGLGIYENANWIIKKIAAYILKHVAIVTVRDEHSLQFLIKYNIQGQLYKDNSYLIHDLSINEIKRSPYFRSHYSPSRNNVGIALKAPTDKYSMQKFAKEIVAFLENNYKETDFWFYLLDTHPGYENDATFAEYLTRAVAPEIQKNIRFHFVPTSFHPSMVLSSFKLMDFVVAMRFHSLVFSYRMKRHFIGISYDEKCTSFLSSVGKKAILPHQVTLNRLQRSYAIALKERNKYGNL